MDDKRFEIVIDEWSGTKVTLEPELGLYTAYDFMGNKMPILGIELYSYDEDGCREPYATLTTNFGEFIGAKDCAYIDTNNNSFAAQLLTMGFCQDTGFTKHSGFCVYPLWKFDKDFLKAIDVHGLYDVYEKKFDEYMNEGPSLPVYDREGEIIADVVGALGIECKIDFDSDGLVVWANDSVYYGAEFYRYLLSEVCEYDKNGAVKGLELDLCNDFYDLCEHNEIDYKKYNSYQRDITVRNVIENLENNVHVKIEDAHGNVLEGENAEYLTADFLECKVVSVTPDIQQLSGQLVNVVIKVEVEPKEFVITMSSGGGTVRDFLTCSSREEAEDVCESYDWRFVDENAFEWSLDIEEREVSLDNKLADAKERSENTSTLDSKEKTDVEYGKE